MEILKQQAVTVAGKKVASNLRTQVVKALRERILTGKYRPGAERIDSPRARGAAKMLDDRGLAVLAALDVVAANHRVPLSAVALAWLLAQPTIAAPIASARNLEQLAELLPMADLQLSEEELAELSSASEV